MDKNQKNLLHETNFDIFFAGHSIDCAIIGYNNEELNILVLKWEGENIWMLPGGFILKDEDMNVAALRILKERTGIDLAYLQQFFTFGNSDRRNIEEFLGSEEMKQIQHLPMFQFMKQRFITTGYFALVDMNKCVPTPDLLSEKCVWIPIKKVPNLIFDHNKIIDKALEQIRKDINYMPFGLSLLPKKFTMKDFQMLYESILDKELDRGNFQKKILKLGILERQEKQMLGGSHKAPYLYKFNEEKYQDLIKQGIGFYSG